MTLDIMTLYCRSREVQSLNAQEKAELGLSIDDDGEFWYVSLKVPVITLKMHLI